MLDIKPMAGALGAEIYGLDLTRKLTGEDSLRIRKLLNEYQVIFFRDQDISPANQRDLALTFGPLQSHPAYDTVEGFPEITILEREYEGFTWCTADYETALTDLQQVLCHECVRCKLREVCSQRHAEHAETLH